MKQSFQLALLIAIGGLMLGSCKKKNETAPIEETPVTTTGGTTGNNQTGSLQSLFSNLSTPMQTFTVDAASSRNFTCTNGTQIYIAPNAFVTQAGLPVSGVVTVQVKDVLSKKHMVLNNAFPVSNGQLLVSGGEVYFNPTQGGQHLKIKPNGYVSYMVPAGSSPSYQMRAFYAPAATSASVSLNWAAVSSVSTSSALAVMQDTSGTGGGTYYYYLFNSDSVNWANCDYFYNNPGTKTTCTVNLSGSANNSNTMVFLSMDGANVIARLNSTSFNTINQQFSSYANSIPVGSAYTIGAISFDGTSYYYVSQQVTMTNNMVINLPALTQTSKAQIEANLSSLP